MIPEREALNAEPGDQAHQAAALRATPAEPAALFGALSVDFTLDASIPIDTRTFLGLLYSLGLRETAARKESYRTYGVEPTSVETDYDEIRALTQWTRNHIRAVIADAETRGLLKRTGSSRTGYRYHVLVALRSYRGATTTERARPIGARAQHLAPERPMRATPQLPLGTALEDLPTELVDALLELARRSQPNATLETPSFLDAIAEVTQNVADRFGRNEAPTIIGRLLGDSRVRNARSPIALLRRGTRPIDAFLLGPAGAPSATPARRGTEARSPEEAFAALPPGMQELLRSAHATGRATLAFCEERDIPPAALAYVSRTQQHSTEEEEEDEGPPPTVHLPADLRDAIDSAHRSGALYPLAYYACREVTVHTADEQHIELRAPDHLRSIVADMLIARVSLQRTVRVRSG